MRIPLFALSVTTSICAFTAQSMALVSLPFLFENTLGLGQVRTGLLMTPWPLVVAVIAPFTGRLADRYPVGILSGVGLAVLAVGLGLVGLLPAHPAIARHRLAHGDLRAGVRLFQHAEQPGDHYLGAAAAHRWRVGDAGGGAAVRADHRGGAGGAGVRAGAAQRDRR